MTTITIDADSAEYDCADDDTILRAALRAGHGMAYSCNVGSCGNCRFELIEGSVHHLRTDPPAWSERDLKRNRWLGCQARPEGPCRIKFRADPAYISKHPPLVCTGELVSINALTHDISEFSFAIDDPDDFQAGQYALMELPGVTGARAYSMCNLPGEGTWNFQIKRMPSGAATGALFDSLAIGAQVRLDGPYGTAYLRDQSTRDLVLLAGGSGLSPMVSIAKAAAAAGMLTERKVHFFYGGKAPQDIIDEAILAEIPGYGERIFFTAAISDADGNGNWLGPTGFIHEIARDQLGEALTDCEIYFAGPAVMSAAVQKMIYDLKVPMDQLHFDEFY